MWLCLCCTSKSQFFQWVCLWFSHQLLSFGTPSGVLQCGVSHLIRGQLHFLSVKKQSNLKNRIGRLCVYVRVFPCIHVWVVLWCDTRGQIISYVSVRMMGRVWMCVWAEWESVCTCLIYLKSNYYSFLHSYHADVFHGSKSEFICDV